MTRREAADLLFLGAIWGAAFLFTRIAVPEFGPLALVEVRVSVAALLLLGFVAVQRKLGEFKGRWLALGVIGTLNTALPFTLFAFATRTVPAGFAAVLNATVPLFGAVLGMLFFSERPQLLRSIGLGIGFAGVALLVSQDLRVDGGASAIAAALSASSMYALSAHLTRRLLPGVPSLIVAAGSLVVSVAVLAIPAALTWPSALPSATAWGATLALAVFGTGLGYIIYFRLLERVGATGAMAVTYLIPLFGMVWGALFLREPITAAMLAGCACILGGVAVTTRRRQN